MKNFTPLFLAALLASAGAQNLVGGQASNSAPPGASAAAGLTPLNLPKGTIFVAKLSTNLAARQCKLGDPVEAEAKEDVKQGHDVVLKKGSMLLGHVATVQPSASDNHLTVAVLFDSVRMKDGKQYSLPLTIQALAPEADISNNSTLSDGRGLSAAANNATVSGHTSTLKGNHGMVDTKSAGVYDIPALELAYQVTNGTHYTLLTSSIGDFKLKKGAQLVMDVVTP